jgi:hypothetical protein
LKLGYPKLPGGGLATLAQRPAARFFFAARRNWYIRAVPVATVISPPPTAASRIATPSGRVQRQLKNASCAVLVFWVMKISSTMRIRKPAVRDVHMLAVRVNFTADSGGAALSWPGGVV